MSIKSFVKGLTPEPVWRGLRASRAWATRAVGDALVKVVRPLPLESVARLKDRAQSTGVLDYARKPILMRIDTINQIGRLGSCAKEPETVAWIEDTFRAGDVLYDIGANVGAYSLVAWAAVNGNCHVYAFEPGFATYAALNHNIFLNRCSDRVVSFPVLLSNATKLELFHYTAVAAGAASHSMGSADGFKAEFTQPLLAYRLDDLVQQFALRPPTHIKMDVDGGETMILEGSEQTLRTASLRSVLIEIDQQHDPSDSIIALMARFGFRLTARHPRSAAGRLSNCIFAR